MIGGGSGLSAQSDLTCREEFKIVFPINSAGVAADSAANSAALDSLTNLFKAIESDSTLTLERAVVSGAASPDGRLRSNIRLARQRRDSLASYLYSRCNLPQGMLTLQDYYIPWQEFRALIAASDVPDADRIIRLSLEGNDDVAADVNRRMNAIKRHRGGAAWRVIRRDVLPRLRFAVVDITTLRVPALPAADTVAAVEQAAVVEPAVEAPAAETAAQERADTIERLPAAVCSRHWSLSSNLAGLGMAIVNLTPEYAFACHWSAALAVYYSGWNYGRVDRKFRTFIVRPEVRWWLGATRQGFYVDAHLAMAAYNFALSSWKYRVQDSGGKNPALGGGLGVGWRKAIGSKGWALEASLGLGCYRLRYDKFENRHNGPLVSSSRKTFFGIDNFAVSVVYNFKNTGR